MTNRPSVDQQMIEIAHVLAKRATCSRLQVGCLVADDQGHILVTGRNGAASKAEHCSHICDCGHEFSDDPGWFHLSDCAFKQPCTISWHAEQNAIAYSVVKGIRLTGATMYVSHSPCVKCSWMILSTGVTRVVYDVAYRDQSGLTVLDDHGVLVEQLGVLNAD